MSQYDIFSPWTESEVRAVVGASASTARDEEVGEPWGRHRWFAEAIAQVATVLAMRRMSASWRSNPPHSGWRDYAPAIRQRADEIILAAKLPPDVTLAEWFLQNEPLLQRDPEKPERIAVVATALVPLFTEERHCWEATDCLTFDFSGGSFANFLAEWYARVPTKLRPFVRRIARKFGLEVLGM
jgi:hypothetical protein